MKQGQLFPPILELVTNDDRLETPPVEVPIQQAARTLGILPSILRRQIEDGELKGRKKGGTWYVELPEKEGELELAPIKSHLARMDQKTLAEEEPPTRELIETLRKQLANQANQIKIIDRQIQELHFLLQQIVRNRRIPWWPFSR